MNSSTVLKRFECCAVPPPFLPFYEIVHSTQSTVLEHVEHKKRVKGQKILFPNKNQCPSKQKWFFRDHKEKYVQDVMNLLENENANCE